MTMLNYELSLFWKQFSPFCIRIKFSEGNEVKSEEIRFDERHIFIDHDESSY
jgi:hypothetical protein